MASSPSAPQQSPPVQSRRAGGHATTLPADRVSAREKLGLGLGKVVAEGSLGTIHLLVSPIYNMIFGLNPALISTIVFIQRIWDAMLDPVCGQISDNFRSRWGRRLPIMGASLPFLALLFAALWWFPAGASSTRLFLNLLIVSLVFYIAHAFYAMALGGLTIEATNDYHERTRLAGITMAFGFAFVTGSQWLFPLIQSSLFSDTITGLRWVTGGCAAAFFVAGLLPIFICKEKNYARVAEYQPKSSIRESFQAVRHNRPFIIVIAARFIASFGYNLVGVMFMYMNNYYVFGGDLKKSAVALGIIGSAFQITGLLMSLFVYPALVRRFGKKRVFQLAAVILMVGCISKLFIYHPGQPWLQFIVLITNGAANAGMVITITAMLGDIADYDELQTGQRREALYMSVMNWFDKAGNSLGSWITGFILVVIGFNAKLGAQSWHTLQWMKICYFAAPFAGALAAFIIMQRYKLDEERVYEIKEELARRHAAQTKT